MSTDQKYRVVGRSGPGIEWAGKRIRYRTWRPDFGPIAGKIYPSGWDSGEWDVVEPIETPASSAIPAGWKLGEGWRVEAFRYHACDPGGPVRDGTFLLGESRKLRAIACLDCAERRGALVRDEAKAEKACLSWCGLPYGNIRVPVEAVITTGMSTRDPAYCSQACLDRAKAKALPAASQPTEPAKKTEGFTAPADIQAEGVKQDPCASHHRTLGSRCELLVPHVKHAGWRPGTGDVVRWFDWAPVEVSRSEAWRRGHRGYHHRNTRWPSDDRAAWAAMKSSGGVDDEGRAWEHATNRKPPPYIPSDPDGDIPNAWEIGMRRYRR